MPDLVGAYARKNIERQNVYIYIHMIAYVYMPHILLDGSMSEAMLEWCVVSGWGSLEESNSYLCDIQSCWQAGLPW